MQCLVLSMKCFRWKITGLEQRHQAVRYATQHSGYEHVQVCELNRHAGTRAEDVTGSEGLESVVFWGS